MRSRLSAGLAVAALAAGVLCWTGSPAYAVSSARGDVFAITVAGGSGHTEVHSLARSDSYHSFSFHGASGFGLASRSRWSFGIGDYDGDGQPDLFGVDTQDSGGAHTAAHVYSGASDFQTAILHIQLPSMGATSLTTWQHFVGDYNGDGRADLFAVNTQDSGGTHTAVHVFDAATNLNSFLLHVQLPSMGATSLNTWQFAAGDYNGDGRADLFGVDTRDSGGTHTAAHVFDAATNLGTFLLHRQLPSMGPASLTTWQFTVGDHNLDGRADLYGIDSQDGSGQTAVHVLDAATGLNSYIAHSVSALHPTSLTTWQFASWPGNTSTKVQVAIAYARAQIGKPYVWGAEGPDSFDCSGLTWAAMRTAGVTIPRTADAQYGLASIAYANRRPGDLVFWDYDGGGVDHVALYIGNDQIIESPKPGLTVRQRTISPAESGLKGLVARPLG